MRRVSEPLDPRDPSGGGSGSPEISAAAERARKQLREDFTKLRAEIDQGFGEDDSGGGPLAGAGFRRKARISLAALALTAAVAAAAANFALNGGRTSKEGGASVPPPSPEPEAGGITAGLGSPRAPSPGTPTQFLSVVAPGLQFGPLGSNGGFPSGSPSFGGPTPVVVVGNPVPLGARGPRGGDVASADPVRLPSSATSPQPETAQPLAYSPPPPPAEGANSGDNGNPGSGRGGNPGNGEGTGGHRGPGEKPVASAAGPQASGSEGNGLGKGHTKAQGEGHDGGSPGKGHQKYDGGEQVEEAGHGGPESQAQDPGGHNHATGRGGGRHPAAAPPPAPTPPAPAPPSGSSGGPGNGNGKANAPGQLKK